MNYDLKITKRVYQDVIMIMCRYGYDISEMLHPTYKNICVDGCISFMNKTILEHENDFGYEDDLKMKIEDYLY